MPEDMHEQGREGVTRVKRWLEATMRFDVRCTVYDQKHRVVLPRLNGAVKTYDMVAQHFNDDPQRTPSGRELWVEVKTLESLASARKQTSQYAQFVRDAYSATRRSELDTGEDPRWDFMFATTHPWSVKDHLRLTRADFVSACCDKDPWLAANQPISPADAERIAQRLWIWLIPRRQPEMTMGLNHVGIILKACREGSS